MVGTADPDVSRALKPEQEIWTAARERGMPEDGALLVVDVVPQRLRLFIAGEPVREYAVSTAAAGIGQVNGSHMTPAGWHEVVERYGDDAPLGTEYRGRKPTGRIFTEAQCRGGVEGDLITTRILRLAGLEDGLNRGGEVDTYNRYIYFHGTNHEEHLGRPASGGCIRLGNRDMVDLFDRVAGKKTLCVVI
jgi:L,D-transpeptidase YbiS